MNNINNYPLPGWLSEVLGAPGGAPGRFLDVQLHGHGDCGHAPRLVNVGQNDFGECVHLIREIIENRITKVEVIEKVESVSERAKRIVESLYSSDSGFLMYKCADIRLVIDKNKSNKAAGKAPDRFLMLNGIDGASGVYVFIDSDDVPVYIGKGGTGQKDDLARRVRNECKICPSEDTGATLSKNIKAESALLEKHLSDKEVVSIITGLRVIAIRVGDRSDPDSQSFAGYLECLLLLLFKPRYNRLG